MSGMKTIPDTCGTKDRSDLPLPAPQTAPSPATSQAPAVTAEEVQLLHDVRARVALQPFPIGPWIANFVRRSELRLSHSRTDTDAIRYIQHSHRCLRDMRRVASESPEMLEVRGQPGLTFDGAFETLLGILQWAIAQDGAKHVPSVGEAILNLADTIVFAQKVRRRLQVGIDGNGIELVLATALRAFILGGRREPTTRPAMLADLGTASQKIRSLAAKVHAALAESVGTIPEETARILADSEALLAAERDLSPWAPTVQEAVLELEQLLPLLDTALDQLHRAYEARRMPKNEETWGLAIQVLMLAMDYVLNALARQAANTAGDDSLDQLLRLLTAPPPKTGTHASASTDDELPIPAGGEELDEREQDMEDAEENAGLLPEAGQTAG